MLHIVMSTLPCVIPATAAPRTRWPLCRVIAGIVALLITAAAAPAANADALPAGQPSGGASERVVVTFAEGTTDAQRSAVLAGVTPSAAPPEARISAHPVATGPPVAVVDATPARRQALGRDPLVRSVDEDLPTRADAVSVNDPAWPDQHGVRRIRADEVWEQTTGADDLVIAVIDTGVDPDNRDLTGRVLPGYDFVNGDADARDDNGHGTAVATIAAASSDGFGVAGLCWRCRVMPVKVLDADGNGFLSDAALGIAWAVEHGADIINVSLGAGGTMPVLDDALAAARDAGALVVASAGNAGTSVAQWPAADPKVVGVAALNTLDQRATYSNHGSWVDLAAPGCNPSGWLDNSLSNFCGTSSSTPLVSGSAALLLAARDPTAAQLRSALRAAAVPVGEGLGAGRIDAFAALQRLPAFADISGNVHAATIAVLASAGITEGCTATTYCPGDPVTRGQIATFLDRALDLPDGTRTFADVPAGHPHAVAISAVSAAGIAMGCGGDRFCPSDNLTRGQMASLLQRALQLPDGPQRFDDVAATYTHAQGIWAIAAGGITTGCEPERFCPARRVTRGQMASFLVRALDL